MSINNARCCKSFSYYVYHDVTHDLPFLSTLFVNIYNAQIISQNVKVLISHLLCIVGHSDGSLSMIGKK